MSGATGIEAVLDSIQALLGWQVTGVWTEDGTRDVVVGLREYSPASEFWDGEAPEHQTSAFNCERVAQVRLAGCQEMLINFAVSEVSDREPPDLYHRTLLRSCRHEFHESGHHELHITLERGPRLYLRCAGILVCDVRAATG